MPVILTHFPFFSLPGLLSMQPVWSLLWSHTSTASGTLLCNWKGKQQRPLQCDDSLMFALWLEDPRYHLKQPSQMRPSRSSRSVLICGYLGLGAVLWGSAVAVSDCCCEINQESSNAVQTNQIYLYEESICHLSRDLLQAMIQTLPHIALQPSLMLRHMHLCSQGRLK